MSDGGGYQTGNEPGYVEPASTEGTRPMAYASALSEAEAKELATLRAKVGREVMTDDELHMMQALAMREYAAAEQAENVPQPQPPGDEPQPPDPAPPPTYHEQLAAGINLPPDPAPPVPEDAVPQHAMMSNLFGAIEHLIGGFGHLVATVPQAGGLGPMLAAATQRLVSARQAFADGVAAYQDVRRGDYAGAISDGERAIQEGEVAVAGTVTSAGTVASTGTSGTASWPSEPQV